MFVADHPPNVAASADAASVLSASLAVAVGTVGIADALGLASEWSRFLR